FVELSLDGPSLRAGRRAAGSTEPARPSLIHPPEAEENGIARYSDNRAMPRPSDPGDPGMPPTKKPKAIRPKATPSKKAGAGPRRTAAAEPSRVGKRGAVVIPAALRRRYGIEEGSFVVAEPCEGGVLIRPALVLPVEVYTPERKAQFLLSNAVDAADYADALAEVRTMGLDPETIPHYKPPGV